MFEDSLFASNSVSSPRRGLTALASFFVQTLFIGALVALPLLFTEALPLAHWSNILEVPPAPAPPPSVAEPIRPNAQPPDTNMADGRILQPPRIPDHVATPVDEGPPPQIGIADGGVYGSTNANVPNSGFMTSVLNNVHPSAVHPSLANSKPVIVSRGISEGLLIHQIRPAYPPIALTAHVQGEVILQAVIGKDGSIQNLRVVSGHPMLIKAAVDAVQQWRYRPYLLNGEPVEVETQVRVTFTIS
jgi:periplasmic protein TonB